LWEPICICETVICGMLFTYDFSIRRGSLRHCDLPLTLSCISISSPNVVGAVACANWLISGWMTALTINMAVLDPKSYKWCKMNNWSHSTSACSREHGSPCFEYKGRLWNKYREWCTKVDILHITVTCVTATINRKTRQGKPETGTDWSKQTRQNPQVDGSRYGFGPPGRSGSGFWTVMGPNRTVFPVQTRTAGGLPGPVANTNHYWCIALRRGVATATLGRRGRVLTSYL
jgi:hypothetical protein